MGIETTQSNFVREMGTFQSSRLPEHEYNKRFCLCRGVSATLTLLPQNVALYGDTFSEIGRGVFRSSEYLLESISEAKGLRVFLPTFATNDYGDHQMDSRELNWAISGLSREDFKKMSEYARRYRGNAESIDKLAEIKSLTGVEHEAMAGILREMAYIDYQKRCHSYVAEDEIMERSKCKLYTKTAFSELRRLRAK